MTYAISRRSSAFGSPSPGARFSGTIGSNMIPILCLAYGAMASLWEELKALCAGGSWDGGKRLQAERFAFRLHDGELPS